MSSFEVVWNDDWSRYELRLDQQMIGFADIVPFNGAYAIAHVEVLAPYTGQGLATKLLDSVFADFRKRDAQVMPLCSFARAYVARHPDVRDLVMTRSAYMA